MSELNVRIKNYFRGRDINALDVIEGIRLRKHSDDCEFKEDGLPASSRSYGNDYTQIMTTNNLYANRL